MSHRILVAEDSRTQAAYLQMLLESEGYQVDVASDGESAREHAEAMVPDLVISDVVMPRMSGFELCRHLKNQEHTRDIPVVLLTALDSAHDLLRGLEAGADNFIRKPYDEEYLLSRIRRILSHLDQRKEADGDESLHFAVGEHRLNLTADKVQIVEFLLSMVEDLSRTNQELAFTNRQLDDSRQQIAEYTSNLERMVQERTEALIRAEKVSAVGELTGGLVQELLHPLQTVVRFAELLGGHPLDEDARTYVEGIARAGAHCLNVTEDLLTFGRQSLPRRTTLDLNSLIQGTVRLHEAECRDEPLEIMLDLAPGLPPLQADSRQIRTVITNLLRNSRQALLDTQRPGKIHVSTHHQEDLAVILVEDDGPGMPPEVERKAFDPFYSTRRNATGMGLPLCQSIVHKHGGSITLATRAGEGVTVRVELPFLPPARHGAS